jgi:hypothetical protein
MICGAVASRFPVTRHQGSFMPLACTHTAAPTGQCASVTVASRSLRARPPWPTQSSAGRAVPSGRADPGVAFEPDHVVEAQVAEEVEQLGVGEAAVGQNGDPDAGGQHLGQPPQASVLIVVAGILQLVLQHAEPDQRRRPAVPGHQLERQGGLPVGVEVGPVHRHDEVGARPDQFRNPGGEDVPRLKLAIAQQPVDLLDGVLGQKAARLGQRFADHRDAQRGPGHHPERRVRQRIDPLGMNILSKNAVKKSPDILKL